MADSHVLARKFRPQTFDQVIGQDAITRTLGEVLPVADGVLRPKFRDPADDDVPFFGTSVTEARAFAAKALERRLKVIGLGAAA